MSEPFFPKGYLFYVRNNGLAALSFSDKEEMTNVVNWSKANDFQRFDPTTMVITQAISDTPAVLDVQVTAPLCPDHHSPMRQYENGAFFCPKKVGSGFCEWKADKHGNVKRRR